MPILRIQFNGGPLNGTIGDQDIRVPAGNIDDLVIHTSHHQTGHYEIVPEHLVNGSGADYQATWIRADA